MPESTREQLKKVATKSQPVDGVIKHPQAIQRIGNTVHIDKNYDPQHQLCKQTDGYGHSNPLAKMKKQLEE